MDFRHADLRDKAGQTRIAYLISRSERRDGRHPEFPDYDGMQIVTAQDINAVFDAEAKGMQPAFAIRETDINGHGTHVAGIAVSSGLCDDGQVCRRSLRRHRSGIDAVHRQGHCR